MTPFMWMLLILFFLLGVFSLTAFNSALRRISKRGDSLNKGGRRFFYRPFHAYFFPQREVETLHFVAVCALNIVRLSFVATVVIFFFQVDLFSFGEGRAEPISWGWTVSAVVGFFIISLFVGDYLPRIIGSRYPESAVRLFSPVVSVYMFLVFPVAYLFLCFVHFVTRIDYMELLEEPASQTKKEIIEIIQNSQMQIPLASHEKKLIEQVLSFHDRIAREVMVPRVDLFCLSADMTIKEAAILLEEKGFSRIPVYRNTVDEIIGVLMYKDILSEYMKWAEAGCDAKIMDAPIESILKSPLYTPETKKISQLLQEFRKEQVHMAIVVDEYGGTEGVVTIEDILEEIVGEISDEYDEEEEIFLQKTEGGWIVDGRMSILDIENQLEVKIPQEGDYDTVGGYIFHQTGTIPAKGFIIHHDEFELVIMASNDRCVEKVRIKALPPKETQES